MVDYVQSNAACLVKALNDHTYLAYRAPLGCTTCSLLKQQHTARGGLRMMGLKLDKKKLERVR